MNRRGLFTGLAGAFAVPVAAVLPKADELSPYDRLVADLKASMDRYDGNLATAEMIASFYQGASLPGEIGPEIIIPSVMINTHFPDKPSIKTSQLADGTSVIDIVHKQPA